MSDDEDHPKRRKKGPSHECTVILIDVGANMKTSANDGGTNDMQLAKETAEWIISRKIFTESVDEFTLVLFGSEKTQNTITDEANIYFCEEEMQKAKIDWLRLIDKEIKASKTINGDFLAALIAALDYMRNHLENYPESNITARNILLITNLGGASEENLDNERIEAVKNGMKALEICFNVIGPSIGNLNELKDEILSNNESAAVEEKKLRQALDSRKMEIGERILTDIAKHVDGIIYSFAEALPMLQRFISRKVTLRGQKFYLELANDLKLPLQLYKKIQLADFKFSMKKYALTTDTEVKRKTVYEKQEKIADSDAADNDAEDIGESASTGGGPRTLEKEETVKGYKFGTTIVPYNEEDQKEYAWKRENRCLKLLQFSERSQILQHYLMDGGAYYCIPPAADRDACIAISALVNAMIVEDTVALTRYVYNVASLPRIMALFPRKSKKGVPMFVGIQLPFYEDFRGLDFPLLNDPASEPKHDHVSAMHAFVKAMDLTKAYFNPETGQFEELLRPRDVPNPKLQNVCKAMKHRALHPNTPLPVFEENLLGDLLQPNVSLLKRASEPLTYLKKKFPLLESPTKKKRNKDEVKEEILPGMRMDTSSLPEGGRFIKTDEVDV